MFTPVPAAQSFVKQAKIKNKKLFIWTNPIWPEFNVKKRLEWAGFDPHDFQGFTHSQNSMACKPNVAYFQQALVLFGLDPTKCILIGDSEKKDGPARMAGIETIILSKNKESDWNRLTKELMLFDS